MASAQGLLLIADIGGYTTYMSTHRMSLAHAEVNTGRLLGTIVDAVPGLELVEIEGDAAFLYREVGSSDPGELLEEVARSASAMHRAFHVEREYVARNLCPCAGCKEAAALTLKFVAHVGEVATQTIRDRLKLVGIDVILLHRLLKNDVPLREYVLMTEDLYGTGSAALPPAVGRVDPDIDGFGRVTAFYVDVHELDPAADPLPAPTWRGRLSRTVYAAGAGLPYMLGRRGRGRPTATTG
ncbi:DUF2652 domain-containing protein [Nocardioides sp. STR2]|uniref:DUF2652 domain-containing protein n=1 Tax=Nocardioides pini TaxID=2975053 RepID=A0ABT4C7H1_9ACTN|nr:DUF2652 domain-containing protein [Nocardioides pini]MCY4724909.1 DUF2652 domain-containing protein [Nocardioides pini]